LALVGFVFTSSPICCSGGDPAMKPLRRGVQVEIVANLFAMTFEGLAMRSSR